MNIKNKTRICVGERLMTLRVPFGKGEDATILSCYAQTLDSDDELKDIF